MNCKKFSCVKLASTKKCGKRFNEALSKWCSNKLTKWYRNQQVKNHCKRSCKNCGKVKISNWSSYWNQHPNIFLVILFDFADIFHLIFHYRLINQLLANRHRLCMRRAITKSAPEIVVQSKNIFSNLMPFKIWFQQITWLVMIRLIRDPDIFLLVFKPCI